MTIDIDREHRMSIRKRYIFYKYLPFVTKRRIIQKPNIDDTEDQYDEVEPRSFVALQIQYEPETLNNETFYTRSILSSDTDTRPFVYELPVISIPSDSTITNYKKMIKDYMLSEFGILSKYISKVQYVKQYVEDELYYINLYQVQLSVRHKYFPLPNEKFKDVPHIDVSPTSDTIVYTEDKCVKFHKYIWRWKTEFHVIPLSSQMSDHYENVMRMHNMDSDKKWEEFIKGIPHVSERVKRVLHTAYIPLGNGTRIKIPI
jgi:hypothetical protein